MRRTPRPGTTSRPAHSASTFGQRGGEGANTGKKAVSFSCVAPDGTKLRRRFFGTSRQVIPDGQVVVAALLPPYNGYGWIFWAVADKADALPDYVMRSMKKHADGCGVGPAVVTVEATRAGKG